MAGASTQKTNTKTVLEICTYVQIVRSASHTRRPPLRRVVQFLIIKARRVPCLQPALSGLSNNSVSCNGRRIRGR